MREYAVEAGVLDKEPAGEQDLRVFLYSPELGKIAAKVKSGRKITSKLAGHLEPLSIVDARLIENGSFQIVDALARGKVHARALPVLALLKEAVLEGQGDYYLWRLIQDEHISVRDVLAALGFDPAHATCGSCGSRHPSRFFYRELSFTCERCMPSPAISRACVAW